MINAGKLNKRIDILKPNGVVKNSLGEDIPKYEVFKTVWANVSPMTGREYMESQKIRAETTYRVIMRYTPGIKADMQIKYKGKILKIESVLNVEEQNIELQIVCSEVL